jgi:hypothetical protein
VKNIIFIRYSIAFSLQPGTALKFARYSTGQKKFFYRKFSFLRCGMDEAQAISYNQPGFLHDTGIDNSVRMNAAIFPTATVVKGEGWRNRGNRSKRFSKMPGKPLKASSEKSSA